MTALDFHLPPELEAHEPPEAGAAVDRSDVRLMISDGLAAPRHARFRDLPNALDPGDVLVVNTSGTLAAAISGDLPSHGPVVVHFSSELGPSRWVVEVRQPYRHATVPFTDDVGGQTVAIAGGGLVQLVDRFAGSRRLWRAIVWTPTPTVDHLMRHGRAIRYAYVPHDWPIDAYQTVFARHPGSAEMSSASRPFTAETVVDLIAAGVVVVPVTLHTGVSSLEAHERPYPERFRVPEATARVVNEARRSGRRIVAVGTTVVRALESAVGHDGRVHAADGWTDLLITPDRGVAVVDGLLTGWHEPEATHLLMLEAVAGRPALELAYPAAIASGYRWHEFGDVHLLLAER